MEYPDTGWDQPMIFDSHAHYDDEAFDGDRDALLSRLPERGVCAVVNCASGLASARKSLALAGRYPYLYAAVGVHPQELDKERPDPALLAELAADKKSVAIGEIGLDYHYDTVPREMQRAAFEQQLALAAELGLPVVVHDREAHEDTMQLLQKYRPRGVVHCFSGSVEMAEAVIKLGMYIGLGGAVTFKNARRPLEVAAAIPLERLLLETDAPYMTPVPYRGKRCDSAHIALTARRIAEVRGITHETVLAASRDNAQALFGIRL